MLLYDVLFVFVFFENIGIFEMVCFECWIYWYKVKLYSVIINIKNKISFEI